MNATQITATLGQPPAAFSSFEFAEPYLDATYPPASISFNLLNVNLNPICHLLALLGAHHILHVGRIRVNQ
jgi:hypothetical protein